MSYQFQDRFKLQNVYMFQHWRNHWSSFARINVPEAQARGLRRINMYLVSDIMDSEGMVDSFCHRKIMQKT